MDRSRRYSNDPPSNVRVYDFQLNQVYDKQPGVTPAMRAVKQELFTASQANSNVEQSSQDLTQEMQKLLEEKDAEINHLTQDLDNAKEKVQKLEKDAEGANNDMNYYKKCYNRIRGAMQFETKAKSDAERRVTELEKEIEETVEKIQNAESVRDFLSQGPQAASNLRTPPSHNVTGIDEYLFSSQNFPQHQLPRNRFNFNVGHGNRLPNITGIDEYLFSSQNFNQNQLPPNRVYPNVGPGIGSPNNLNMDPSRQDQERSSSQSHGNVNQRNPRFE
ncbi:hypothetical protein M3Y97_01165900 [Aphelenchoides bicaudatus]|nr:hypothetical protein M3Y97_01165900 [Aphelenchoides bicaudatus]